MAVFEYRALSGEGVQEKGMLEADSPRQVRQILRDKGLTPLSVASASEKRGVQKASRGSFAFLRKSISTTTLALITRQLATLIQASMPIEEALAAIAAQQEKPRVKNILLAIRSSVMEGFTLAASLELFPQHFPHMYQATVAAGEHAGHLDKVLVRLADHTEQRMQSRQKVQLALMYPVILLLAAVGIVSFLLGYVVPDVIKVFIDSGQELPLITQLLISASEGFKRWWPWLLVIITVIIFSVIHLLGRPGIRLKWHSRLLSIPVIGRFSRVLNTAQFAGTLSILTSSGVALVDALEIAARVVSNDRLKCSIKESARKVSEGTSLHLSLKESGYFPPLMLHMIASGEATGELDTMLDRTAQNQQMELENKVSMLVGLSEPLMLVIMGSIVLTIVLAILLPILNMNTLIGT